MKQPKYPQLTDGNDEVLASESSALAKGNVDLSRSDCASSKTTNTLQSGLIPR